MLISSNFVFWGGQQLTSRGLLLAIQESFLAFPEEMQCQGLNPGQLHVGLEISPCALLSLQPCRGIGFVSSSGEFALLVQGLGAAP